jgi:hypothetical protein
MELFSVSSSSFPYNNHFNTSVRAIRRRRRRKNLPLPEFSDSGNKRQQIKSRFTKILGE